MNHVYISGQEVSRLLPMGSCVPLMESALRSLARGEAVQPLRSVMWLPEKTGLLGMMPACASDLRMIGVKVITVFPRNRASGYSSHQGVVLLYEGIHGELRAIVDGEELTAIRTAAVSAVATKLLARDDAASLAVLGSGTQARKHVEAMLCARKISSVKVWSRDSGRAESFCAWVASRHTLPVTVARNPEEAIIDADIICTTTASPTPVLSGEWIKAGAHINAVGSCTPAARELDTSAVVKAKLFTDRYESLFREAGDFIIPRDDGAVTESHVKGELGEVLTGARPGRESDDEITLFKSLGLGIEDLYAAHHVWSASLRKAD